MDFKTIKAAVKSLNAKMETKLKVVGVKRAVLEQDFMDTVGDFEFKDLPKEVQEVYTELTGEDIGPEDAKKEKRLTKEGKEKAKKTETKKEPEVEKKEEKEYKKSDFKKAAKDLIEKLELEDDDDEPLEIPKKPKDIKKMLLDAYTLVMDDGIDLEAAGVAQDTIDVLDFLFGERADTESAEDKQKRMVDEIGDKEENKEPVKTKKETKKETKPKKETKKEVKSTPSGTKGTPKERRDFITDMISDKQYKSKDIIEATVKKFPGISPATIRTEITDGKNPKYCKFKYLVKQNDEGILSFTKTKP